MTGALEATLVTYVTPVVALPVGWTLPGESIAPAAIGGFCLVAAGFALLKNRDLAAELGEIRGAGR